MLNLLKLSEIGGDDRTTPRNKPSIIKRKYGVGMKKKTKLKIFFGDREAC